MPRKSTSNDLSSDAFTEGFDNSTTLGSSDLFGPSDSQAFDSPAASVGKPAKQKAPKDVYTLVLLLSFLFFVAASVLLYLDLASYK